MKKREAWEKHLLALLDSCSFAQFVAEAGFMDLIEKIRTLPVQPGVWSGITALPRRALAMPAPSTSATWITSSAAIPGPSSATSPTSAGSVTRPATTFGSTPVPIDAAACAITYPVTG